MHNRRSWFENTYLRTACTVTFTKTLWLESVYTARDIQSRPWAGYRRIDAACDVWDKMTVTMDELPGDEPLPDFDAAKDFYANYEPKEVLGR